MPETVPWFAKYQYPSEANKATKLTPRISPKSGSNFLPGSTIRLEFPAQGYINPGNTTLEFDVTLQGFSYPLYTPAGAGGIAQLPSQCVYFQNNIQSIFQRGRVLYGSGVFEDMDGYNVVVRALTEWTGTNNSGILDQTAIAEGQAGFHAGTLRTADNNNSDREAMLHSRSSVIQGIDTTGNPAFVGFPTVLSGNGNVPNSISNPLLLSGVRQCTRRYQVTLPFGLFTQGKLIPTKWMASQFAIELTLTQAENCIMAIPQQTGFTYATPLALPNYCVSNVNLIPEILLFDSSYDEEFLRGLQSGGIPIKFSTWKRYGFSSPNSSSVNFNISEKSRSVKSIFVVQRRNPPTYSTDSGAFVHSSASLGICQNYQYRIGGLYFPQSPVQMSTTVGGNASNGGAEAFVELQKAMNTVGDYRLSTGVNPLRWAYAFQGAAFSPWLGAETFPSEADYHAYFKNPSTDPPYQLINNSCLVSPICGNVGSCAFGMAINLETSSGLEISGLNAEEMSDITFSCNYSVPQNAAFGYEAYTYVDKMIVLKENNIVVLIE